MPTVYAQGKTKLIEPVEFGFVDQWAPPLNSNFGVTDAAMSGTTTINVALINAGAPTVTLVFNNFSQTDTPWLVTNAGQNLRILLTGTLTFPITVIIPQGTPGFWLFHNRTGGAHSVTVKTDAVGSTGIVIAQSYLTLVFSDGTNVYFGDGGGVISNVPADLTFTGFILPYGGTATPSGWLLCNGATYSNATYPALYDVIGTTWGGTGPTSFKVPDFRGAFLRGAGAGLNPSARAVASYEADVFTSHTHGVTDPGHAHGFNVNSVPGSGTGPPSGALAGAGQSNTTYGAGTGISIQNAGGAETAPKNFAVNYVIKT